MVLPPNVAGFANVAFRGATMRSMSPEMWGQYLPLCVTRYLRACHNVSSSLWETISHRNVSHSQSAVFLETFNNVQTTVLQWSVESTPVTVRNSTPHGVPQCVSLILCKKVHTVGCTSTLSTISHIPYHIPWWSPLVHWQCVPASRASCTGRPHIATITPRQHSVTLCMPCFFHDCIDQI